MNSLLTNLIPPKIPIWPKFLAWNSRSKSYISLDTWWILTSEGSKFKSDYLQSKNSCILLIIVVNFKLRLINFAYFFETPDIYIYIFDIASYIYMYIYIYIKILFRLLCIDLSF